MEFTGPKPTGTSRQSKIVTERRNSVRLAVHSPAYTSLNGLPPEKARDLSEIMDIGESGMSIQTSSPLEVDRNLDLCLDLSETKTRIGTTGRVVWSNRTGRAGIRFQNLAGQSLRELREWLFVNVLTAFDHARGKTAPEVADATNGASKGPRLSQAVPRALADIGLRHEPATRAPEAVRDTHAEANEIPNALRRELEIGAFDRPAALQLIAKRALTFTRATGAAIALSAGDDMICEASAGSDAPPVGARLQASSGFSGECVRTGRCLRCDDSEADDRVDRVSCRALGVRSIVAVPIRRGSRVAGLLEVFSPQPYAFNPQDISVLQQLAGTVLLVVGDDVEIPVATPDPPMASSEETQAPRVEAWPEERFTEERFTKEPYIPERTTEERFSSGLLAGTMASVQPVPRPLFHKILLAAAAITFVFALFWLTAPWISSRISQARTSTQVREPQDDVSKPLAMPVAVDDLTGLRKLAEQGDPAAQFALGARYATGEDVKQDYTEAVRWFSQAADHGHILAQATLGAYYWAGRGVPPDLTKAYFWSALAQAGGDQASKYRVAVLTSRMSRSEILGAQQQAKDWLRNHQMAGKGSTTP
jgi:hypothetical protein